MWAGCHLCQRNRWTDDLFRPMLHLCAFDWQLVLRAFFIQLIFIFITEQIFSIVYLLNILYQQIFSLFLYSRRRYKLHLPSFSHIVSDTLPHIKSSQFSQVNIQQHESWTLPRHHTEMSLSTQVSPTIFECTYLFPKKFHFCVHQ